jgi:membrane protein
MGHWFTQFFPNLRQAGIRWSEDDASGLAASVAYYLALSLFPLVLVLTSSLGLFFKFTRIGQDAKTHILETVETHGSPVIKKQFADILSQLSDQSLISCPSGFMAAILAAIGVFAQLDRGFDRIWKIPRRRETTVRGTVTTVLRQRFWAFCMLLSLGGAVALLFVVNMVISQLRSFAGSTVPHLSHAFGVLDVACTLSANAILFGMVYRWLPKKRVGWREALRGGLLVAAIWELGRIALGVFLIGMRYTSAYGAMGSFIALLLWCYYGTSIVFFGAEYVQVLQQAKEAFLESAAADPGPKILSIESAVPPTQAEEISRQIPRRTAMRLRRRLC